MCPSFLNFSTHWHSYIDESFLTNELKYHLCSWFTACVILSHWLSVMNPPWYFPKKMGAPGYWWFICEYLRDCELGRYRAFVVPMRRRHAEAFWRGMRAGRTAFFEASESPCITMFTTFVIENAQRWFWWLIMLIFDASDSLEKISVPHAQVLGCLRVMTSTDRTDIVPGCWKPFLQRSMKGCARFLIVPASAVVDEYMLNWSPVFLPSAHPQGTAPYPRQEEGRLKELQKILKQIDPEKLQQKSLEKAKGNKAGDKGAWPCCCRGHGPRISWNACTANSEFCTVEIISLGWWFCRHTHLHVLVTLEIPDFQ